MTLVLIFILYILLFALLVGFAVIIILELVGRLITNAPFVPAPRGVAEQVGALANLKEGQVFYDLGSGEGGVVRAVAQRYPTARAVGVELAPFPYYLARLMTSPTRLPNASYLQKNMFNVSLTDASVVYLYLLPKALAHLSPKLRSELAPGARVITCDFTLPDWTPTSTQLVGKGPHTLYIYTKT